MFDVAMKATYMKPSVYVTKKHNKWVLVLVKDEGSADKNYWHYRTE